VTRAGASAASSPASMSIGEVLAQLRPEFPDTTISKLRFLESEGLVEPERTAAGTASTPVRTSRACATSSRRSGTTTCRCG
jgi:hypothetical protein